MHTQSSSHSRHTPHTQTHTHSPQSLCATIMKSAFSPRTPVRSRYHASPPGEPTPAGERVPTPPAPHSPSPNSSIIKSDIIAGGIIHQYQDFQYKRPLNNSARRCPPYAGKRGTSHMMRSWSLRCRRVWGCVCVFICVCVCP